MDSPERSILLVEDDAALRLLCRVNLELEGFRVREAATIEDARRAVDEERPRGVFLDVNLGGERCDDLLDELRGREIPVVLVTGSDDVERYRGRATEVLAKPYMPEALIAAAGRLTVG